MRQLSAAHEKRFITVVNSPESDLGTHQPPISITTLDNARKVRYQFHAKNALIRQNNLVDFHIQTPTCTPEGSLNISTPRPQGA